MNSMELYGSFSSEQRWHIKGQSYYEYEEPVRLAVLKLLKSGAHIGRYMHAVDIATPHPDVQRTIVYSPISGTVKHVNLSHSTWGPTPDYATKGNYINISPDGSETEFVELSHVAPLVEQGGEPKVLTVGTHVEVGQPIAIVGMNGYIEAPNGVPDPHLHIMVGQWLPQSPDVAFTSLIIRWLKNRE